MNLETFLLVIILIIGFIFLISLYAKRFKWLVDKDEEIYKAICKPFENRGFQVLKIDVVRELELKEINYNYSNQYNSKEFNNLNLFRKIKLRKEEKVIWLIIKISNNPFCSEIKILKSFKPEL